MTKNISPLEHGEQVGFINWFRNKFPHVLIYSIPNGGKRYKKTGADLKKEGIVALVVNSSNFLNEKSEKFRKEFINLYSIFSAISLSNVKKITFGTKSEPASIIIFTNKKKNNNYRS